MAWLCYTSWDGLNPRGAGLLTIVPIPLGFRVTVKLESEAQSGSFEVTRFDAILDVLEEAIRTGRPIWRTLDKGTGARRLKEERRKIEDARKAKE